MENLQDVTNISNHKQEPRVERPEHPIYPDNYLRTPFSSGLNKLLFDYLQQKLQLPTNPVPPPTFWPVLMPDRLLLSTFAQYKPEPLSIPKNNPILAKTEENAKIEAKAEAKIEEKLVKPEDNKSPSTAETTTASDQMPVKKERPTENGNCSCSESQDDQEECENKEDKSESKEEKGNKEEYEKKVGEYFIPKQTHHRIKNLPGLILQRVKNGIRGYFSKRYKLDNKKTRFIYVDKVVSILSLPEKKDLLNFLENYDMKWKTWNTIQNYLKTNPKYGAILVDVVIEFLGPEGLEDFNEWRKSGRMKEKARVAAVELKDKLIEKFLELLQEMEERQARLRMKAMKQEQRLEAKMEAKMEAMMDEEEEEHEYFINKLLKKEEYCHDKMLKKEECLHDKVIKKEEH